MKHVHARLGASLVVAGLSVGTSAVSYAASTEIEEIVVTAQKRETNLQQTPIAITAITQEQIQLNRIEDFADIALHTPSMSYTELQGFSQASIRGVGTDLTNLANETAIAMYEDGVYRGATFSQTVPQFDMERIEVLRGPQGTLYGRNATGGAINIVTRMPSATPEFNASFTGGDYNRMRVELGASGPITDGILGRASFITDSHSGFNDNKTLGDSEGDDSLKGGHAALQFDLSETAELVLRGNYTRNHGNTGVFMVREISPTCARHLAGQPRRSSDRSGPRGSGAESRGRVRTDIPASRPTGRRRSGRSQVIFERCNEEQRQAVRRQRDTVDATGRRDVEADSRAPGCEVGG